MLRIASEGADLSDEDTVTVPTPVNLCQNDMVTEISLMRYSSISSPRMLKNPVSKKSLSSLMR